MLMLLGSSNKDMCKVWKLDNLTLRFSLYFLNWLTMNSNCIGLWLIFDRILLKYLRGNIFRLWLRKIWFFSLNLDKLGNFMKIFRIRFLSLVFMSWGSFWRFGSVQRKSFMSFICWTSWDIWDQLILLKK